MYPVAPASFILLVKRILDILSSSYRLGTLRVRRNLLRLMKTTIGTADGYLVRHNPMPREDCPRTHAFHVSANRQRLLSSANESFLLGRRDRFG